jgi:REP element-mobilizing transposase RayT
VFLYSIRIWSSLLNIGDKVFTKEIFVFLEEVFNSVCKNFEAELVECKGEKDHVHLLVNYPPKVPISNSVFSIKNLKRFFVIFSSGKISLQAT